MRSESCQYSLSYKHNVDLFDYNASFKIDYFKYSFQECPNCGYIETDISKPVNADLYIIKKRIDRLMNYTILFWRLDLPNMPVICLKLVIIKVPVIVIY